jgi:hypothetical protein
LRAFMLDTICASFNDVHVLHAQPAHNRRTANAPHFLFLHCAVFLSHEHVMFTHSRIIDWRTSAFDHASQYHVHSVTLMRDTVIGIVQLQRALGAHVRAARPRGAVRC